MQNFKTQENEIGLMTNPAIKRLKKIVADESSSTTATYTGVVCKTIYFMILTAAGVALYFILQPIFESMGGEVIRGAGENVFEIAMTVREAMVLAGAAVVALITALLSIFIRAIVPVTGTLYVMAEGYCLAFITDALKDEYKWMGFAALLLTILIVMTLLILYSSHKITVSGRLRVVISTVFITLLIGSLVTFIISLIPGLQNLSAAISGLMSHPVISIGLSAFFVLVACIFLITDFEDRKSVV